MQNPDAAKQVFDFFTEIGILNQLASTLLNHRMPEGLHLSHFIVINHMTRMGEGQTPVEIAQALQVTKATMTHTIGVLRKRRFIKIGANPADGRSKLVYLTPTGVAFREKAIASLLPVVEMLIGKIDMDRLGEVMSALRQIRSVLDENRED